MTTPDTAALPSAIDALRNAVAHVLVDCTLAATYCPLKTAHGRTSFVDLMNGVALEYRREGMEQEALLAEAVVADFLADAPTRRDAVFPPAGA